MILLNGPNTPFGRLALATALELGIEVENRVINVYTADFLDDINPLRQIPTLLVGEHGAIFDSRVICAYFGSLRPEAGFVPTTDWSAQTRCSLAVGLMEASVARTMEMRLQPAQRNMDSVARQDQRVARAIAALEAQSDEICQAGPRIDRLSTAVALEYIDFRAVSNWRGMAPRLTRWLEDEAARPSLRSSRPYDIAPQAPGGKNSVPSSSTSGNTSR